MHTHRTLFTFGDIVFLKTDPEQVGRMVLSFKAYPGGVIYYELGHGSESSDHHEIEISREIDPEKHLGIKFKEDSL